MVAILLDSKYADSLWCKKIHAGLIDRLREKRIPFCEIYDACLSDIETIFIIGSDYIWLRSTIMQLNKSGITPIVLCNQTDALSGCIYNCVCSDVTASLHNLLDVLKAKGSTKLAIYGANPTSMSDMSRIDTLLLAKDAPIEKIDLFINEGSLHKCFEKFYPVTDSYDAVICTNDFAAVSLVKNLRRKGFAPDKKLFIVSCTSSKLSEYYREDIISLDINYSQYGKAAVHIYETLQKHDYISRLTVRVTWELNLKPPAMPTADVSISPNLSDDTFYDDPELNEMLVVDKLLTLSDHTDREILDALVQNFSTEEIAQKCFLSVNAIKYRIKKLVTDSGATDKHQIVTLLKEYIN